MSFPLCELELPTCSDLENRGYLLFPMETAHRVVPYTK